MNVTATLLDATQTVPKSCTAGVMDGGTGASVGVGLGDGDGDEGVGDGGGGGDGGAAKAIPASASAAAAIETATNPGRKRFTSAAYQRRSGVVRSAHVPAGGPSAPVSCLQQSSRRAQVAEPRYVKSTIPAAAITVAATRTTRSAP